MTAQSVEEVIRRAQDDPAFRQTLEREPDTALHGYDISYAERAALIAGDETKLEQLGVSPDLSRLAAQYNRDGGQTP